MREGTGENPRRGEELVGSGGCCWRAERLFRCVEAKQQEQA